MKITNIELANYRAFLGKTVINVAGKNLLIYGENGSGKSSLFRALEDFFQKSYVGISGENIPFVPHFKKTSKDAFVKLHFEDKIFTFSANTFNGNEDFFKEIGRQNPFFTYKRILRTFLFDKSAEKSDKVGSIFFRLLIEEILQGYVVLNEDLGSETIGQIWNTLLADIKKKGGQPNKNFGKYQTIFNDTVENLLVELSSRTNDFLSKYFKNNVRITLKLKQRIDVSSRKNALMSVENAEILTEVHYFGDFVPRHYDFLNEARLSSLAVCMYFASLKIIPPPHTYKILFLDDIFIGLDMSNRLPLLEILKSEFADYQIFMTTYDRAWFETAKRYLDEKFWKSVEMYVGKDAQNHFDVPVIIQSKNYYERAKEYFAAFDYPACANYLRKECEKSVKEFLPHHLKYDLENEGKIFALETLFNNLVKYAEKNGLNTAEFKDFKTYQKIFNALSHDDLTSPIYKAELEKSFLLAENLQKLKVEGEIKANTVLLFEKKNEETGELQKYEIQLSENLRLLRQDSQVFWSKSLCNVFDALNKRVYWENQSLQKIFDNVRHSLNLPKDFDTNIWFDELKTADGKSLSDLLKS